MNWVKSEPLLHFDFFIRTSLGAVGVPAVLSELGDEGLLPLGQLRWLGSEDGGQLTARNEEGVDGAARRNHVRWCSGWWAERCPGR